LWESVEMTTLTPRSLFVQAVGDRDGFRMVGDGNVLVAKFAPLLSARQSVVPGGQLTYTLVVHNGSSHGLDGTQAGFEIPSGVTFVASPDASATQVGSQIVVTIGRLDAGCSAVVWFNRLAKQFIVWSDFPAAARSSLKQEASPNSFWKATSRLQNHLRRG